MALTKAYELLQEVKKQYTGSRELFVVARLSLRTGLDLNAIKPNTAISSANAAAYFAADMFIQGLKTLGKNITPERLQQALAHQTWQIPNLVGPTKYPAATQGSISACSSLIENADGTAWKTVESYSCSDKTFPLDPKFQG